MISATNDRLWSRKRRRVHHKVRTGCKACKLRRQKVLNSFSSEHHASRLIPTQCDEQRPICSGCSRHLTECLFPAQECSVPNKAGSNRAPSGDDSHLLPSINHAPLKPPSTDLNLGDLELLHQFLTSTCIANGQLPEITSHVQITVLPMAKAYPFVMHGILAMAATHLSWLRPSRHVHYATVAAKNHQNALTDFRSALQNINEQNYLAVISYSKSILWCSFAEDEPFVSVKLTPGTNDNWLPQWFGLLRGSCRVVETSKPWIKNGPHLFQALDSIVDYSNYPDDHQISNLICQMQLMTDSALCSTVLSTLREAFARAFMHHHNTPLRNAINFWVGSLSDDYIQLLQVKEPWALVVLAHFCVLVHRTELSTFRKGHATRLVLTIAENLDTTWRRYVQWPCVELGIEAFCSIGDSS